MNVEEVFGYQTDIQNDIVEALNGEALGTVDGKFFAFWSVNGVSNSALWAQDSVEGKAALAVVVNDAIQYERENRAGVANANMDSPSERAKVQEYVAACLICLAYDVEATGGRSTSPILAVMAHHAARFGARELISIGSLAGLIARATVSRLASGFDWNAYAAECARIGQEWLASPASEPVRSWFGAAWSDVRGAAIEDARGWLPTTSDGSVAIVSTQGYGLTVVDRPGGRNAVSRLKLNHAAMLSRIRSVRYDTSTGMLVPSDSSGGLSTQIGQVDAGNEAQALGRDRAALPDSAPGGDRSASPQLGSGLEGTRAPAQLPVSNAGGGGVPPGDDGLGYSTGNGDSQGSGLALPRQVAPSGTGPGLSRRKLLLRAVSRLGLDREATIGFCRDVIASVGDNPSLRDILALLADNGE